MKTTLNRRTLLRGLLGGTVVSIGLPPLEIFLNRNGDAYAATGGFPSRFGLFYWGNGNLPEFWTPETEGEGDEWALSEHLMPLADLKSKLAVVTGMSVRVVNEIPHGSGRAGLLTGIPINGTDGSNTFMGASIDQIIAAEIGTGTRFRSLEFGAAHGGGQSYNGAWNQNPPEGDPYLFFERVFGGGFRAPGDEPIIDPTIALRRSVLDAVLGDATKLRTRLGSADQSRLDQHMDGIRSLELQLARLEEDPPDLAACVKPPEPEASYPDIDGRPQLSAKNRVMCDMMAMAFACDQTRVASNFFTSPVSNNLFPDAPDGHHNLTHDEPDPQLEVGKIVLQCVEEYAYMLSALDAVEEGDGTLLDHCAVLATSDVSLGRTHSLNDYPILIGGGACGAIKTDVHYRSFTGENASRAMLSLIRAMGIPQAEFGVDDMNTADGLGAIEP